MNQIHKKKWFILTTTISIFITLANPLILTSTNISSETRTNLQPKTGLLEAKITRIKRQPAPTRNEKTIIINLGHIRNNEEETIRTEISNTHNEELSRLIGNGFHYELTNITPSTAELNVSPATNDDDNTVTGAILEAETPKFIINFTPRKATLTSVINTLNNERFAIPIFIEQNPNFSRATLETSIRNHFSTYFLRYVDRRWNCRILYYEDNYSQNRYEVEIINRNNLIDNFTTYTARINFIALNQAIRINVLFNESSYSYLHNLHNRIRNNLGRIANNRNQTIIQALIRANPGCTVLPNIVNNLNSIGLIDIATNSNSANISFPSLSAYLTFTVTFNINPPRRLADIYMINDLGIIADMEPNTILTRFSQLNPQIDMHGLTLRSISDTSAKLTVLNDSGSIYKGTKQLKFKVQSDKSYYEYSIVKNSKNNHNQPTPPPDGSAGQISSQQFTFFAINQNIKVEHEEKSSSLTNKKQKVGTSHHQKTWLSKVYPITNLGKIKDNMPKTILEKFYELNNINAAARKNIESTKVAVSPTTAIISILENDTFFEEKLTLNFKVKPDKGNLKGTGIWISTGVAIAGGGWLLANASSLKATRAVVSENIPLLTTSSINTATAETGANVITATATETSASVIGATATETSASVIGATSVEVGASLLAEEAAVATTSAALAPETLGLSIAIGGLISGGIVIYNKLK